MELEFMSEATQPKYEDDYRLVAKNGKNWYLNLIEEIKEPITLLPLIKALSVASVTDTVYLRINSGGGQVDTAISILSAIHGCAARVIAICDSAASAATLITLACDEVWLYPYTEFMIHSITSGTYGTTKDNKKLLLHQEDYHRDIMIVAYKGFVDEKEVVELIDNADTIWLYGKDLEDRFTEWAKINNKTVRIN